MKEMDQVPELRFPGFEERLERMQLGDVSSRVTVGIATEVRPYISKKKEVLIIRNQNIRIGFFNKADLEYITKGFDEQNKTKRVQKNDLLVVRTGSNVGNACVVPAEFEGSQTFTTLIVRPISKILNSEFLSQHVNSFGLNEIARLAVGAGKPNLNAGFLKSYRITLPTLPEQQKIATFLSEVDQKIQALKKKNELLAQYKKGIMQKLFSQELRFTPEGGGDYPDWKEVKLGEVAKFSKGKGISKNDISEKGKTECIRYGELYTHYHETISEVTSRTNIPVDELVLSDANDVIIPASGETQIDIAKASCVLRTGVALGGDLNVIRGDANGVFLSYYLNGSKRNEIACLAQGSSVMHLYASQLTTLNLEIPFLQEQAKIASFLSAIDEKIEQVEMQIAQAEIWKKGLLQQMFV